MKTNFKTILFCTALLALPLGCQKGMDTQDKGEVLGKDGFTVLVREVLTDAATKTYLTQNGEIAWSDDDTVLVFGKTKAKMVVATMGTDATHGFLTKIDAEMPEPATTADKAYTALYPAAMFPDATATNLKGTLPTEYDFQESLSNPLKCFPLYAQSDDKTLEFKSVCGLLEIGLTGTTTVTKVIVSTTSATTHLAGDFTIDPVAGTITLDGAEDSVKINCGTDGVTLNRVAPVRFYIPLVPGTYDKVKVTVKTKEFETDGGACIHATAKMAIEKNMVHVSQFPAERNAVQMYPGGPYWSTCNLGATHPADYGSKYMWGMTEKIYDNDDIQTSAGGTYSFISGYDSGFCWESYINVDPWDGKTAWATIADDPTASSGFSRYTLAGSVLSENDDVAGKRWGSDWRTTTDEDFKGLMTNCFWDYTTDYKNAEGNNVTGYIVYVVKADGDKNVRRDNGTVSWNIAPVGGGVATVTGSYDCNEDTHIFIPAAGFGNKETFNPGSGNPEGHYWTSILSAQSRCGQAFSFKLGAYFSVNEKDRRYGFPIRPVRD